LHAAAAPSAQNDKRLVRSYGTGACPAILFASVFVELAFQDADPRALPGQEAEELVEKTAGADWLYPFVALNAGEHGWSPPAWLSRVADFED